MISTHILDTTKGAPASNVKVTLEKQNAGSWVQIASEETNADGRIAFTVERKEGNYRLTFFIEDYYKNEIHFFMNTPILFKIDNTQRNYHVPLLLNPYGYSTYRGS